MTEEKTWYVQLFMPENKYLCVDWDTSDDRYHCCYYGPKEKCEQYIRMKTIWIEGYCGGPKDSDVGIGTYQKDAINDFFSALLRKIDKKAFKISIDASEDVSVVSIQDLIDTAKEMGVKYDKQ